MGKFYLILVCALGTLMMTSCGREALDYNKEELIEAGEGQVDFNSFVLSLVDQDIKGTRAEVTKDYIVTLYDNNGKVISTWAYKDVPQILNLAAGKYNISIISHEMKALDTIPYYEGESEDFEVKVGEVTEIEPVICTLGVIKVEVSFEEKLIGYMDDKDATSVKLLLNNEIIYEYKGVSNCQPIYIAPTEGEKTIMSAVFESVIDGYPEMYTLTRDLTAGDVFSIKCSVETVDQEGSFADLGTMGLALRVLPKCRIINVNYDLSTDIGAEEEVIPEGGDEDLIPTIEGDGFNIAKEQIIPEGGMVCRVKMKIPNGIAHLRVKIDSPTLTPDILSSVGLSAEFDLAHPGDLEEGLRGLKFPVADEVIGKTELIFDISEFTGLIPAFDKGVEHTHKFILDLEDKDGNGVAKTLMLVSSRK